MDGFPGEFNTTCKEEFIAIVLKLVQKIKEEQTLANSSCEASLSWLSKLDSDIPLATWL